MARRGDVARQARLKASPTDQHARKIAAAVAKGRMPTLTPDLQSYLADSPREIFAAFEGAARHMPPAGEDEALACGYLFVLQGLLEHLRYRTDRGYGDAVAMVSDFQATVAARAEAGHIDGPLLTVIASALQQAKIPVSTELAAALEKQIALHTRSEPHPADVGPAIVGMLDACGGDPFALVGSFAELGHAMPGDTRGALAGSLALSGMPGGRSAAVLLALDPDPQVRRPAAEALRQVASSLSSTDVRRLIAMRNWRPESERSEIDVVIRQARAAGIDCAP